MDRTQAAHTLMQQIFTPAAAPIPGVEFAMMTRFGEHIGGDVADVFKCGEGVFVSLADIEGSGRDAAVHAAMVKYGIRAYASAHRQPLRVLRYLNALYMRNCECEGTESFASLFLGMVDTASRTMTYVSAGYEAALLVYPNGFSQILRASGPIVGVFDGGQADFAERTIEIDPGCILVAVSDGVTDAGMRNRRFGLSRIRHLLSERAHGDLNFLLRDIVEAASAFCRGKITDDMAVLAVRFGLDA